MSIENIISRILASHICTKENTGNFLLNEAHELSAHKKIQLLFQLLKRLEYENLNFDLDDLSKQLYNLKNIRNQLAHNIIHPSESFESAKTGNKEIVFLIIKDGKIKRKHFTKIDQEDLLKQLNHIRSVLKEIHRFVKNKNHDQSVDWYPE